MSLLVLAFANKENVNSHNWERSMIKYGYKHKLVGRGTKWVNFMTKIRGIYDYLQNVNDEYIVVIDAFDAFANKSSEGLLKTFLTFQADIVISAETSCGSEMCIPVPRWQKYRRRYINAGFYMGRREAIINLYKWLLASGEHDDQKACCKYLIQYPEAKIALDYDAKLCANIELTRLNSPKIRNQSAYFVHTPGMTYDLGYRYVKYGRYLLGPSFETPSRLNQYNLYPLCIAILILAFLFAFVPDTIRLLFIIIIPLVILIIFYHYDP